MFDDTDQYMLRVEDLPAHNAAAKARTDDDGKPPLAQLPWAAINDLARVQAYGHKKYGDFNNYRKGMEVSRQLSCALRHISEYMEGSNADAESGLNPLAHALCRIAFVLQNIHDGVAIDDRYKVTSPSPIPITYEEAVALNPWWVKAYQKNAKP